MQRRTNLGVKVDSLSKKYQITSQNGVGKKKRGEVWALRDVNFEIERGQVVGIIGRNGAGKSTLLKLLSRVIYPTSGKIDLNGRVGSLLEVGTGFHMELSGRENIYLSGAILGMKHSDIKRKFDEITDFAGIDEYLDTPVKRYSSGMYMRLAFAVAAHLDPDILIIDEVLAVGDIAFQNKCLNRINNIGKHGSTVLFVSHNMNIVNGLCSHALLLDKGRALMFDYKDSVIRKYIELISDTTAVQLNSRTDREGDSSIRFNDYFLEDVQGNRVSAFRSGQDAVLAVSYSSSIKKELKNASIAFALRDSLGNQFTDLANRVSGHVWQSIPSQGVIRCIIPRLPLMPGRYTFGVFANINGSVADWIVDAGKFEVIVGDFYKTGRVLDSDQGFVLIDHSWSIGGN